MNEEERRNRALEVTIAEKVVARLRGQVLAVYLASLLLSGGIAISLVWEHSTLSELSRQRISEYRLLVSEGLDELHRLDLEEVARRTHPAKPCPSPLPRSDAADLLTRDLERAPTGAEIDQLLEKAQGFGVCDIGEVEHIYEDPADMARVETVYRILLGRSADPLGKFIYGYWLASGVGVEAVARDIMASAEFQKLKKLAEP